MKFVKCWQISLELNSKGLYQSSGKEKQNCYFLFSSSTKREIRHLHAVVLQRRLRNVQKSVIKVQSYCFANLNQLLICRSRCRRRRRCYKLPICWLKADITAVMLVDIKTASLCSLRTKLYFFMQILRATNHVKWLQTKNGKCERGLILVQMLD